METIREREERGTWSDEEQEPPTDPSEVDTSTDEELYPPELTKPKVARQRTPPLGPKPNDQPLSLAVPMYDKVRSSRASTPEPIAIRNIASVSRAPSQNLRLAGKSQPPPVNLANRFASALHVEETYGNISSGDESAGSVKSVGSSMSRRKRVQADPNPIPAKAISRPPPLTPQPATPRASGIATQESPIAASLKLQSLAAHLSQLCGNERASSAHFLKYLQSSSYISTFAAMKAALEAIAVPKSQVLREIDMLKEISGSSDDFSFMERKDIELSARATGGDISAALDLLVVIKSAMLSTADGLAWANHIDDNVGIQNPAVASIPASHAESGTTVITPQAAFPPSPVYSTTKKPKSNKRSVQHPQNWRTVDKSLKPKKKGSQHPLADFIPAYAKGATPQDSRPGALYTDNEEILNYTQDECRRQAEKERRRRQEAIRQAGKYFGSNVKGNGKQVAAYYAMQAREAAESARRWDLRAARELVENQRYAKR